MIFFFFAIAGITFIIRKRSICLSTDQPGLTKNMGLLKMERLPTASQEPLNPGISGNLVERRDVELPAAEDYDRKAASRPA